jgi:4-alpha-glucanotransferase
MYERLSVATYATHDHSPIRALWNEAFANPPSNTGAQARATLEKIALFAGLGGNSQGAAVSLVRRSLDEGGSPPFQSGTDLKPPLLGQLDFEKDFYPAIMEALFKCNSWIAIVMITDLLACRYRFNVPGTKATLNWTRRIQRSIPKLCSSRKEQKRMQLIHELLVKTGRV